MKVRPDSILDTAEALFGARSFDGVSTRMISETAGVNIAMLSYYFGSKEGLFEAVLKRRCQSLEIEINQSINNETAADSNLRRFLSVCARFLITDHPAFLAMLVRESTASVPDSRMALVESLTLPIRRTLDAILESGSGLTSRMGGDLCFALMLGIFAGAAVSPSFANPARVTSVEWLVDAVLQAVGAEDTSSGKTDAERPAHGRRPGSVSSQPDSFEIGMVD
ncbi:MAG: TetR/AcrR family transcriptional regulator [Candidatus Hydrogenedentes bacterium]|nr:TetR/AcrR family transcriptional regulator [Candidatus Hydrogenedentota bacterium]